MADRNEDHHTSSDGSKMLIKLKIPKPDMMIGSSNFTSSKDHETMNEGKRVCPECKKEFSSGKALGGHMRIHASKNTFLKPSKFKKTSSSSYSEEEERKPDYLKCVNEQGQPTCYLCGKNFPTMKSLFGHMRCHPDRVWRGILPPPNTAAFRRVVVGNKFISNSNSNSNSSGNSSSSEINGLSSNDNQVIDLTKFLKGWSVTEKRGRKSLKIDDEDDDVLLEAVEDLMNLANSDPPMAEMAESESVVTHRQLRIEGENSNNSLSKTDANLGSVDLQLKVIKEEEIEGNTPSKIDFLKSFSDHESDSKNKVQKKNPYKKRKKMKLMMELDHHHDGGGGGAPPRSLFLSMASPPESKYKCTTCNKCFASHQALGGHRSSHNKSKLTSPEIRHQIDQEQEQDYESFLMNHSGQNVEFPGEIMLTLGGSVNSTVQLHHCKICDKNFPTGQALGGHKRCHWTGTFTGEAPSSQVTSTGEAASQTGSGRKVLDFDLNEVPSTMIEEDGYGYASSSYNSNIG